MILYIIGPYRAETRERIQMNIDSARAVALEVWARGHVAICPHLNTAQFEIDGVDDKLFQDGYLQLVERCDGALTIPGWDRSEGSKAELRRFSDLGLPIYNYPYIPPRKEPTMQQRADELFDQLDSYLTSPGMYYYNWDEKQNVLIRLKAYRRARYPEKADR